MAFPAKLNTAYGRFTNLAVRMADAAAQASATMAAGSIPASVALGVLDQLRAIRTEMTTLAATPGIAAHAQRQSGATVDIAAEYAAMVAAIDAAIAWITTNFPQDGDGYLLLEQFEASGARTERTFTPAQTAALRALLDTLAATVD